MRNFKSFGPRRVVIDLDKGFIVVTGPNGSGKSNIIDGVRFVLGDLSARSLRADKMSGVIYDGGREASPMAIVTLHLDNSDRRLPIDTDTVTIARKVDLEGESEYSLNGRHVARGQLVDILRMAGLSSSGYNLVMQGTITRLADITPEDRRSAIEDLVGIAEYDTKKAEAREQLQQAEVNLRIASVRIGDVQSRLERLEEERNDALRYNFIQKERNKLQANIVSYRLFNLQAEKAARTERLEHKNEEAEGLKRQRDQLYSDRTCIEAQRRKFDEEIVDKGNVKLISLQKIIGDLMANSSSFRMEIESGKTSLKGLQKIYEDRNRQFQNLEQKIRESQQNLTKQKNERDRLKKILDERSTIYTASSSSLLEMKQSLEKNTAELKKTEDMLNDLRNQALKLNTRFKGYEVGRRILDGNLKILKERRDNFELTLKDLQQHFSELQKLQKNEQESLGQLSENITKSITKEASLLTELEKAEKTVKIASSTVTEFEAHKSIASRLAAEEAPLQKIEEMGRVGAIQGIFGQVETIVKVSPKFQKAIEAASAGWLKSVVVSDLETALRCVESLKKMKLGQLRFIPLKEVRDLGVVDIPKIEGIIGLASNLVKCEEKYVPAVNFIFGDTLVASGEKSAFLASRAGYRAVDVNGDIYEARGGLTGGYYREPLDFSALVPSEKALDGLSQSVKSLGDLLVKRRGEIGSIDEDVTRLKEERARRSEIVNSVERELKVIELNLTRARQNIVVLEKRSETLSAHAEKERELQTKIHLEREGLKKSFLELASKRRALRVQTVPDDMNSLERSQMQLNSEVTDLGRQFSKVESDVNFLESNLKNILLPEFEEVKVDIKTIEKQITGFQERVVKAQQSLDEAEKQVNELNKSKEELSTSLFSVKEKRREFELQLDQADERIRNIDRECTPVASDIHELEFGLQRDELEIKRSHEELLTLGCEIISGVSAEEVKRAETSINLMRVELERLGSVNQLAITQYEEQKGSYKELSVRQNELEKERRSILQFMEEIEQKKRETFMQAFKNINENFSKFFTSLTGSGKGSLSLQNQDDPFTGGVDIFVQFPGKASRLIAGASGGEKSVTAVAFIFAIQSLFPAPFYMFDEIDAHLDPFNAERLADLMKERAADSQIISMTLRDVIMDRADRLFGVYIQDGISRVVSARIAEAM